MIVKRVLLIWFLALLTHSVSAQVVLQDTSKFVAIGRSVSILEDKTAQLSFGQVRDRTDFVPSQSESFQFDYSSSSYWLKFQVVNQHKENIRHWLIGLSEATSLDYVDLYLLYPNGRVVHQAGGLKRPYVDQGFFAATPFFRVALPPNTPVTAYFRVSSSLAIVGKVTIWDEYQNLSKGRVTIFVVWTFLGLFILRSLTNFVLARFISDRQFRFYALCTFLLYLSTLSRTGIYPTLFSEYPDLLDWLNYGLNRLLPLGLAAWIYSWLDNRPVLRPLRWLLMAIMGVSGVGALLPFFRQTMVIGQFYATLIWLMYALFFASVGLVRAVGLRVKWHFVLPITLCMIPLFLYQSQLLGIIPYRPIFTLLVLLALSVEMISMSLVMGQIVQSYIRERIVAANALMREKVEVDKLQELDTLKTRFFTNISHELRTPLTLILGPLSDFKRRFPAEPIVPLMERNGNRLLNLINQLLDLSKLEAGQLKPDLKPGNVAAFLRMLAASFESLALSRTIQFSFTQSETELWADFDHDKVEKIVTNVVANAFKFTPNGNEVRLSATYEPRLLPNKVILIVQDTGIGIPSDVLPHIFERFYQQPADARSANAQLTHPYEGTGIGLALVNELVEVLGGRISVVSTEGIGTTFTLTLPLSPVPTPPMGEESTLSLLVSTDSVSQIDPSQTPSPTPMVSDNILLIIDDNADIRAYIRSIFADTYQILEATDGQDGLEQATLTVPDLIICDLMMPRMDGFTFCRTLKTAEATSHIPVIMLTAKATVEDRIEGFELGADDYLTKPFNQAELRVRVRNLLDKQARLRHYFGNRVTPAADNIVPMLVRESLFLEKARQVIDANLANSSFGVEQFSQAMNLSPSQLLRKLKALTSLATVEFLRQYRLEQAATLLTKRTGTVSDVAYQVGFESMPYFTKVFREKYGVVPSEYTK